MAGEANSPNIVDVQKRVSEIIEYVTKLRVVSFDKLEGIDSLRPVFIVDANMDVQEPYMHNWANNTVTVDVYYYGTSTADCKAMGAQLNAIFCNPIKVGDIVTVPDEHNTSVTTQYILTFSMTFNYITIIDDSYYDITMGHLPHISDYNDDVMGEIYDNNVLILKEEDNGSDQDR